LKNHVTLFMLLLAALNILLSKISRQADIIIGTPSAGRPHNDLEHIIGFFINLLPLRNYPTEEKTFSGFLAEVKTRVLGAFENQDYPIENLVNRLALKRDPSRHPLLDAAFTVQKIGQDYEKQIKKSSVEQGLKVSEYRSGNPTVKYDLVAACAEKEESLVFSFEYAAALFKEETIRQFIDYFKEILDAVLENQHIRLKDIRLSHNLVEIEAGNFHQELDEFEF